MYLIQKALEFSLMTFGITIVVAFFIAALVKAGAAFVQRRTEVRNVREARQRIAQEMALRKTIAQDKLDLEGGA